jgi:PPP family 3-phenylpropionic acid transporter
MTGATAVSPRIAPEVRIALFYFTQMMPLGAAVVYAGIWFASKGISSDGIGIINSVPVIIMITLNLTIGRIADRASDWRKVIVMGSVIQAIGTLGLFFVDEFWGILAVWTLSVTPNTAISPVADAATMRLTKRNGTSFGPIRACSTLGYMVMVAVTGILVARYGGEIFVPLYVGLTLLKAAMAQQLPNFRAPGDRGGHLKDPGARRLKEVLRPWFVLPLVGYAMVFGTHIILNAFAALLWKEQGISEAVIGWLITVGAFAEASMMIAWKWIGRRVPVLLGLAAAALVTVFRWAIMGLSPPAEVLFPLQLLHAITFAMGYLSCVHFIALHTSEDIAAEAQSFYVVIQQTMAVIAVIGFGWLTGTLGAQAYFVAAGFAMLGAVLISSTLLAKGGRPAG